MSGGAVVINTGGDTIPDITLGTFTTTAANLAISTGDALDTVTAAGAGGSSTVLTTPLTIFGGAGNDTLTGGDGADAINGGPGNDTIVGGAGNDTLSGDEDNDTINEGAASNGTDVISGGLGMDAVTYFGRSAGVVIVLDDVGNDGETGENDNVKSDNEWITGTAQTDTLVGSAYVDGGTVSCAAADAGVVLSGGDGADNIWGGPCDDTLSGGNGDDILDGGTAAHGNDVFSGGAGTDTVLFHARGGAVTCTLDDVANDGESSETDNIRSDVENIVGSPQADNLYGSSANNVITGGAGADVMGGGAGDDTFLMGTAASGADSIDGGAGSDTLDYSARTATTTLTGGLDGTIGTGAGDNSTVVFVENVYCPDSAADCVLTGNASDNYFKGGTGAGFVNFDGGMGDDILEAAKTSGNGIFTCGEGNDIVIGHGGANNTAPLPDVCELKP
jgi:Ca2+-binding RTX toxin-like protein